MTEAGARSAAVRFRIGVILAGSGALALALATPMHPREVVALPLFLVVFPALAWAQLPLLAGERLERIPVYLGSALSILLLGGVGLSLGVWGFEPEDLGLVGLPPNELLLWTAGLTGAALLFAQAFDPLERAIRGGPHPILLQLLPRTPPERGVFAGLSLAAGWGEEMAYRGYVPAALLLLIGEPWLAMGIAALGFGGLHAYQGAVGVVRTAGIGFLLGVPVIVTGSILPGMLAHALVDLVAGLLLGPRILRKAARAEEAEEARPEE